MFSLKQKDNGEFFLTYDRERKYINNLRGVWIVVGRLDNGEGKIDGYVAHCIKVNESAGLLCCKDDEGNVRTLVLTE